MCERTEFFLKPNFGNRDLGRLPNGHGKPNYYIATNFKHGGEYFVQVEGETLAKQALLTQEVPNYSIFPKPPFLTEHQLNN